MRVLVSYYFNGAECLIKLVVASYYFNGAEHLNYTLAQFDENYMFSIHLEPFNEPSDGILRWHPLMYLLMGLFDS